MSFGASATVVAASGIVFLALLEPDPDAAVTGAPDTGSDGAPDTGSEGAPDAGSEGAPDAGSEGAPDAGSEGAGSEGAGSEGAGSEGAGSEGAGSEGAAKTFLYFNTILLKSFRNLFMRLVILFVSSEYKKSFPNTSLNISLPRASMLFCTSRYSCRVGLFILLSFL